jgi:ABC-type branched-subunit amino acid transport system ATPase component
MSSGTRLESVSVLFGGVAALTDVSMEIREGLVTVVIGPNGAGKTTLLNALNRLVPISSGSIHVLGRDVTTRTAAQVARLGVARSFQNPRLIDSLTVEQNMLFGLYSSQNYTWFDQYIRPWRAHRYEQAGLRRTRALLEATGLGALRTLKVSELAYGSRKVVEILRALAGEPRLLILDEPTSGLGETERTMLAALLGEHLRMSSTAVLLVEHHFDFVRAVGDLVVGLAAGQVFANGDLDTVLAAQESLLGVQPADGQVAASRNEAQ